MSMIIFKFMMEMLIMIMMIIDQVLGLYCAGHVTLTIVMSIEHEDLDGQTDHDHNEH